MESAASMPTAEPSSHELLKRVVTDGLPRAEVSAPEGSLVSRRIALLASGTRGDIQPMIVVADELRRRGHSVVLTVNTNMMRWAETSGHEIVPLPLDSEHFLKSDEGRAMLANGQVVAFASALAKIERAANPAIDRAIARACEGADLILSTVLTMFRASAHAESSGLPHRLLSTVPVRRTGAYAHILCPVRRLPLRALNRFSHDLMLKIWWKSFAEMHDETRLSLGLSSGGEMPKVKELPSISLCSQALLPDDTDDDALSVVTGFPQPSAELRARLGEGQVPAELLEWIAAGDAPVFFGFGSMPVRDPKALMTMVAEIAARRRLRALVDAGWSDFDGSELPGHVRIATAFDHDRVLPLCRAAVHHGGAGTTAAALRANLPSLIVSCLADQPFWGWRLSQLSVGATFPFQRLSAARLDASLQRILAPELAERAKALGARLRAEPGASHAANVIEHWLGAGPLASRACCARERRAGMLWESDGLEALDPRLQGENIT